MPTFHNPELLLLLLAAPVFLLLRPQHTRVRGAFILALRLLVFAALVLALAEPHARRANDRVTTYFVVDRSGSIPTERQAWSLDVIRRAVRERAEKHDRAGLVVFGRDAIIEETPSSHFDVGELYSVVDRSSSDVGAAIRLALSTFPDDTQRRVVLFSDGNETRGDALAAADHAASLGCPIDVVPLRYAYRHEVLVEGVSVPRRVSRGEPFKVRVEVGALSDGPADLTIYADGQLVGRRPVTLHKGTNVFVAQHAVEGAGFHMIEAQIDAKGDGVPENNRAEACTLIEDEPVILVAGDTEEDVRHIAAALRAEGIACRTSAGESLPSDLGEWQDYDAIVFSNLAAERVSAAHMEAIESLVKDLGTGFVMVGGEKGFGAGGYLGTPIERVLPVGLGVDQNRVLPNGAVTFILDHIHCIGDRWSKDIAIGTLNGLTRQDGFGLLAGGQPLDPWPIPLQSASNKPAIQRAVDALNAGEVDDVDRFLDEARAKLEGSRYGLRHIVFITDGMGGSWRNIVPSDAAVDRLVAARISLSIVLIEPHGAPIAPLQAAAARGGGNFYVIQPHQYDAVPQVFIRESTLVKKGIYFEEKFTPSVREGSEILAGIDVEGLPPLYGYNATSRRDPTEVPLVSGRGDAILAHWRYGLGRSVAFTSDASTRWGKDWLAWSRFRQFWAQVVRWAERRLPHSPYRLTLRSGAKDGTAEAIIDAEDEAGASVNFLALSGSLVDPALKTSRLAFDQIAPGKYRATFPVEKTGGHFVNVIYEQDGRRFLMRGGYVPPYNPEYARFEDNTPLLRSLADRTGGRVIEPGMDLFAQTGAAAYTSTPLAPYLLLLAVILFPLDVFVRRVILGPRDLLVLLAPLFPPLRRRLARQDAIEGAEAIARRAFEARAGVEGVSADQATEEQPAAVEGAGDEQASHLQRLRDAKKRAQREIEKR